MEGEQAHEGESEEEQPVAYDGELARSCASLTEVLRRHASSGVPGTVGAAGDTELTYPEFWACVVERAAWFTGCGVKRGDAVALEMDSTTVAMVASLAIPLCGAVLVPTGVPRGFGANTQERLRALAALRAGGARWYVSQGAPMVGPQETAAAALRVVHLSLAEVPERTVPGELPAPVPDPDDVAVVQFSSGSLAAPRGIVLTHHNLAVNLRAITDRIGLVAAGRGMSWLPFSHDMGLIGSFWACVYAGFAFRALPPGSFVRDPLRWIEQLGEFRATHTTAPPFAYEMAARAAERAPARLADVDLSALHVAVIGAERVAPRLCERFEETFAAAGMRRHVLLPAYGLAENCVAVACRAPLVSSVVRRFDTAELERGRLVALPGPRASNTPSDGDGGGGGVRELIGHGAPLPGTEVRIVAADGQELPEGCVGEIRIAGGAAARWTIGPDGVRRPAAGDDGLVATGDMGALADGELFVIGRSKEAVKYAGRLLAPTDIEQTVLDASPTALGAVAAVAVTRDAAATEDLVLFLELADARRAVTGAVDEAALVHSARLAVLREFRMPVSEVYIARRGALPRTASGKVRRLSLGAAAAAGEFPPGVRPAHPAVPAAPLQPK
ncbi:AMP-binding protein [Streptomyces sp. NPDC054962]